jgi:hypothetical protein
MTGSKHPTRHSSTRAIEWMRGGLIAAALLCAASPALAVTKTPLTGFNGIAFGTKFAVAKQRLGAKAKADKSPSKPSTNILLQFDIPLYGETVSANYTFGTDDRLKIVYTIVDTPTGDFAVCHSHWQNIAAGLKSAFGAPDVLDGDPEFAKANYTFANGAKLEATQVRCLLMVNYTAPGYKEP